jgi:hypothetical protein
MTPLLSPRLTLPGYPLTAVIGWVLAFAVIPLGVASDANPQTIPLTLTWNEPPWQPSGQATAGYEVIVEGSDGSWTNLFVDKSSCTNGIGSQPFPDMKPSTTYKFQCRTVCITENSVGLLVTNYSDYVELTFTTGKRGDASGEKDVLKPILVTSYLPTYTWDGYVDLGGTLQDESSLYLDVSGAYLESIAYQGVGGGWRARVWLLNEGTNSITIQAQDVEGNLQEKNLLVLNLNSVDSDGDGLSDTAERHLQDILGPHFTATDPTKPDTDGDGLSDYEECWANTNPNDANDALRIQEVRRDPASGQLTIRCRVVRYRSYTLERSTDLRTWEQVEVEPVDENELLEFKLEKDSSTQDFYRLVASPPN